MGGDQQDGRTPGDGAAQDCHPGGRDLTRWTTPAGRALARAAGAVSRRLGPHAALVLTLLLGATVATAPTAATGVVYESVVEADGVTALDHPMLEAAIGLRSPGLDAAATGFTHLGGTAGLPILAALAVLVLSLARRSWMPALLIAAAGG
ncbi:phosphatidic acid phosphatase, partial [Arthrobacter deserti]|nr:phosphatidic acid phosphatase [Arthrobacter deserti]